MKESPSKKPKRAAKFSKPSSPGAGVVATAASGSGEGSSSRAMQETGSAAYDVAIAEVQKPDFVSVLPLNTKGRISFVSGVSATYPMKMLGLVGETGKEVRIKMDYADTAIEADDVGMMGKVERVKVGESRDDRFGPNGLQYKQKLKSKISIMLEDDRFPEVGRVYKSIPEIQQIAAPGVQGGKVYTDARVRLTRKGEWDKVAKPRQDWETDDESKEKMVITLWNHTIRIRCSLLGLRFSLRMRRLSFHGSKAAAGR